MSVKKALRELESKGSNHGDDDGGDGPDGRDSGGEDDWFWYLFEFPGNTFSEASDDNCSLLTPSDEDEITVLGPDISGR